MLQICEKHNVIQLIIIYQVWWAKLKRKASAQFCCEDMVRDTLVSSSHMVDMYERSGTLFCIGSIWSGRIPWIVERHRCPS